MREYKHYPSWVHAEFRNWARWCWMGSYPHPMPDRQCGSAESDYQTPLYDSCDSDKLSNRDIPIDIARASVVDQIWQALPPLPKKVIRAEYPQRQSHNWENGRHGVAAQIGLCLREYEDGLSAGYRAVFEHFEREYR